MSKIMPVASAFFITAALCGAGVPGMASFWAELLVLVAAVKVFPIRGLLAIASLVIGALFALRVVQNSFFNEPNPKFAHFEDVTPFLALPRMILIGFMIFFGLFPQVMVSLIKSSIVPFIQGM
jgi:NADH-quinone oxidoreductase subunit M